MSGHQLFWVTPNLRSKIFQNFFLYQVFWTEFFIGWSGPTFFGHAKFETKLISGIFHLQRTVDSEFFRGSVRAQIFFGHVNFEVKIFQNFFIDRTLWTLNFSQRVSGHQLYLVTPILKSKKIFGFFSIIDHCGLWIFCRGCLDTNFFWSH